MKGYGNLSEPTFSHIIREIFSDNNYVFETIVVMKGNEPPKRLILFEGNPKSSSKDKDNFKNKIRICIESYIKKSYLIPTAEQGAVNSRSNIPSRLYIINQNAAYHPFRMLEIPINQLDSFKVTDQDRAMGIAFRFKRKETVLWGYQRLHSVMIPVRQKRKHLSDTEIFEEMPLPLFPIASKVHLIIADKQIITCDPLLLQDQFGPPASVTLFHH